MPSQKLVWLTDIHLNFLSLDARKSFYQNIQKKEPDGILITGDIAEAPSICELLQEFSSCVESPIYFVLGNHDYYYGNVTDVRENIFCLSMENKNLYWLGRPEIIKLNAHTILIGQDGWADARYGNFDQSFVGLNDRKLIFDLFQSFLTSKATLKDKMQSLADVDAKALESTLNEAAKNNPKRIIVATHVPPFPECCWHDGKPSDENWLPFFASKATGDVLLNTAKQYPMIQFLILCGHTHTKNVLQIFENLEARTGSAEYYYPEIQAIIDI